MLQLAVPRKTASRLTCAGACVGAFFVSPLPHTTHASLKHASPFIPRSKWMGVCYDALVEHALSRRAWRAASASAATSFVLAKARRAALRWRTHARDVARASTATHLGTACVLRRCVLAWRAAAARRTAAAAAAADSRRAILLAAFSALRRHRRTRRTKRALLAPGGPHSIAIAHVAKGRCRAALLMWRGEATEAARVAAGAAALAASALRARLTKWRGKARVAVVQRGLVTALAARRRGALLSALFGAWALRCFTARALEARVRSLRAVRLERALVAGIGGWHLRSLRKVRIARALGALGGILAGYEARAAAAAFYALRQSAAGDAAKERVAQEFAASKLARGVFARLRGHGGARLRVC